MKSILSIFIIWGLPITFSQDTIPLRTKNQQLLKNLQENQIKIDSLEIILNSIEARDKEIYDEIINLRQIEAGYFDYNELIEERKSFETEFQTLINTDNFPHELPLANFDKKQIVGFGIKIHPIFKTEKFHSGIDIPAPTGTIIMSTISGTVIFSGNSKSAKGIKILIENNSGIKTEFAHLDSIMIKQGETIEKGQPIGTVGNSGVSIASHLHYEIIINGEQVNPILATFDKFTTEELEVIYTKNGMSFD